MAFETIAKLPHPDELDAEFPVHEDHRVEERREEVRRIIEGVDDTRRIVVLGPCSAWPAEAVREYADWLTRLQEEVKDKLLLIMRAYIQKPRTTVGWPGPLNQSEPTGPVDIVKGIHYCRKMMHEIAKQIGIADEALFTHNADYFGKLLTWIAVGARSGEDMEHRYVASGFDAPVGVKHPTSGDIQVGVNSVVSVQSPHEFAFHGHQVRTPGQKHAHLILRGGGGKPNYGAEFIAKADAQLRHPEKGVKFNPALILDASHDNSGKDPMKQPAVIFDSLAGIKADLPGYRTLKGWMMESFNISGSQKIFEGMSRDGLSITDGCIGRQETRDTIRILADGLDGAPSHA